MQGPTCTAWPELATSSTPAGSSSLAALLPRTLTVFTTTSGPATPPTVRYSAQGGKPLGRLEPLSMGLWSRCCHCHRCWQTVCKTASRQHRQHRSQRCPQSMTSTERCREVGRPSSTCCGTHPAAARRCSLGSRHRCAPCGPFRPTGSPRPPPWLLLLLPPEWGAALQRLEGAAAVKAGGAAAGGAPVPGCAGGRHMICLMPHRPGAWALCKGPP